MSVQLVSIWSVSLKPNILVEMNVVKLSSKWEKCKLKISPGLRLRSATLEVLMDLGIRESNACCRISPPMKGASWMVAFYAFYAAGLPRPWREPAEWSPSMPSMPLCYPCNLCHLLCCLQSFNSGFFEILSILAELGHEEFFAMHLHIATFLFFPV